jgi:hypothetical protein
LRGAGRREGTPRDALVALALLASGGDRGLDPDARPAEWRPGEAWVQVSRLHAVWQRFSGSDRTPRIGTLGAALARIGGRVRPHDPSGRALPWVYVIPASLILDAAEDAGVGDPDEIGRRMGIR